MRQVHLTQRVEAGAVALLAVVAVVVLYPTWWWVLLAAFLVFDVSILGYVRSAASGATSYNLVHNYAFPALAGLTALVTQASFPVASTVAGVLACAWAFHVGVDRALGYGLKMPDAFRHTHLGRIGKDPEHVDTDRRSAGNHAGEPSRASRPSSTVERRQRRGLLR